MTLFINAIFEGFYEPGVEQIDSGSGFVSSSPTLSKPHRQLPGGPVDLTAGGGHGRDGDRATIPAGSWEINGKVVKSVPFIYFSFLPYLKQGIRCRAGRLLWESSFQYAKSLMLLLLTPLKIICGSLSWGWLG